MIIYNGDIVITIYKMVKRGFYKFSGIIILDNFPLNDKNYNNPVSRINITVKWLN